MSAGANMATRGKLVSIRNSSRHSAQLGIAACIALLLAACGGTDAETEDAIAVDFGDLSAEVAALEQRAQRIADRGQIERLQRAYGYYLDRGDWDNSLDLMSDDVTVEIGPIGVYAGKDSVRDFFYASAGGVSGLRPEQLNDHIMLQPVITLSADGQTARGRWQLLGLLGQYQQYARWQVGPYENEYRKENGIWKISAIHWVDTFTVPFKGGLTTALDSADVEAQALPAPDRPSMIDDLPWPEITELPFHFSHPVNEAPSIEFAARDAMDEDASVAELGSRAATLAIRVDRLEDEREIEIVQRTYGYYVDKNLWGQIADLFTEDGTLEIGGRGVFVGRDRALEYLEWLGQPDHGRLYDHTQMDGVITVAPDGLTAKGRWRAIVYGGNEGGISVFGDCIYENEYRKEDGVWKLSKLHSYFIMYTTWEQGWAELGWPNTRPEEELPPDLPPTIVYDMYPGELTAPIHYENPVTGTPAPAPIVALAEEAASWTASDIETELASLDQRLGLVEDAEAVESLHNIYGYYRDARDWDDLADLYTDDASLEVAEVGVYDGKDRIRQYFGLTGNPGVETGSYTANFQYQPVVHVAPDRQSARLRARAMTIGGTYGGSGVTGGGVYENEYVNEDGVWKIKTDHFFTTFLADYELGWGQGALPVPGPSDELPPDRPPTVDYQAYPAFVPLPFHYNNPVSGLPAERK
jgi:ketosteroid isomerase-like protein/outer membrane murein-binding lipoprotein Lpp